MPAKPKSHTYMCALISGDEIYCLFFACSLIKLRAQSVFPEGNQVIMRRIFYYIPTCPKDAIY